MGSQPWSPTLSWETHELFAESHNSYLQGEQKAVGVCVAGRWEGEWHWNANVFFAKGGKQNNAFSYST